MKRILFATDFSEACSNAFTYLKNFIQDSSVKIDFVHVYDIPVNVSASIPHQAIQGMLEAKDEAAVNRMNQLRLTLPEHQRGKMAPIQGEYPSADITETAIRLHSDLIVMGMKKKYDLIDKMVGSTTIHTIDKSNNPVLAIPNDASFDPVTKILFPTAINQIANLSEKEIEALNWLNDFLHLIKSPKIHLVHISSDSDLVDITKRHFPIEEIDFSISHAESVEEGIFKFLTLHDIHMLAFYKAHRSFWTRLYRSSITRKLLYQSRLPLLVFS